MEIKRVGSQPSVKGPADWFTGTVRIDPLFQNTAPAHAAGASVTFEPGARNNWHTHPAGQILLVTDGVGYFQEKGKPIQLLQKGDVINILPDVEHWHGAAPDTELTHIAINVNSEKGAVIWLQRVTEEEYHSFK